MGMTEYIERNALIRQIICDMAEFVGTPNEVLKHDERCNYAIFYLENASIADVEPVRHAHWEYWDGWMSNHNMRLECACSACGYKDVVRGYGYDNIKHLPERCHGCWAKMDEEVSE